MKTTLVSLVLATALAGGAFAQTAPVGGPDAKGNAAIKHPHTVNDGSAKPGANSFTRGEAMRHIEHSGFSGVGGLVKGKDGVWRGTAIKGGAAVNVAMDFKGNVTQSMAPVAASAPMASSAATAPMPATTEPTDTAPAMSHHHLRHHRRHHATGVGCNTSPGPNGVACSGRDRNKNGISDKEDHAINGGAKP